MWSKKKEMNPYITNRYLNKITNCCIVSSIYHENIYKYKLLISNISEKLQCEVYGPPPGPPAHTGSRDAQELALYSNLYLAQKRLMS